MKREEGEVYLFQSLEGCMVGALLNGEEKLPPFAQRVDIGLTQNRVTLERGTLNWVTEKGRACAMTSEQLP